MKKLKLFILFILLACIFLISGIFNGDLNFVASTATYGNFDVPNTESWVMKLKPGIDDYASGIIYGKFHLAPLKFVGILFIFMLLVSVIKNKTDLIWRKLTQWSMFVIARLGVLRVSGICPVKRTQLGVFPFLNCQACEMATGGCPIGMIQWGLINKKFPLFSLAILLLFGSILGRAVCGWLCPFGFFADVLDRLINIKKLRSKIKVLPKAAFIKYFLIIFIFTAPFWAVPYFCIYICQSANIYGLLPYYLTTGLEGFTAAFQSTAWLRGIFFFHMVSMFILILLAIIVSGRWFCRYICPLGAIYGLFNYVSPLQVKHDSDKCTNCNRCIKVCPMDVDLRNKDFATVTGCIRCGRCIKLCEARYFSIEGGANLKDKLSKIIIKLKSKSPLSAAKYAKDNTKFYKDLYKNINMSTFEDIPVFSKHNLYGVSPYSLLSSEFTNKVIHYGETSGSSGTSTPVFLTKKDFDSVVVLISGLCPYSEILKNISKSNRTALNLLTFGYTIAGFTFGMLLQHYGMVVAQLGSRSTIAVPERSAKTIKNLMPATIASTPLDFMGIMEIIREDFPEKYDEVLSNIKVLLSTAEPCAVSRQKAIEAHFGLTHINVYASVDGIISLPCSCGEKHIVEDIHYTELFDENMKLIGEYGSGRLAFTTRIKKATPMVRYLIDDYVTISKSNCPYGFKKSITPHGRFELTVKLKDKLWGTIDLEDIIYQYGLFMDYKITIENDKITIILEKYPIACDKYEISALASHFEEISGLNCEVELIEFGDLTSFRKVREAKSILKVLDKRSSSTQDIPVIL